MKRNIIISLFTVLFLCSAWLILNKTDVMAAESNSTYSFNNLDVNDDWIIDIHDIAGAASHYNEAEGSKNWTSLCDVNKDKVIDVYDLVQISKYMGTEQGNSCGNINNYGLVAKKGDWTYFSNQFDNGYLYKVNSLGTSIIKISNDVPIFINVIGDYIYYSNDADNDYLYKIKTDGTGRVKLNSEVSVCTNISDGWLYYINDSDNDTIYKIKNDGTGEQNLSTDAAAMIYVVDNYIYFNSMPTDNALPMLYRIKTDGTGKISIGTDDVMEFNYYAGWIYYTTYSDHLSLYKMKSDGSGKLKLVDDVCMFLNVSYDKISYGISRTDISAISCNLDGSGSKTTIGSNASLLQSTRSKLYYMNYTDSMLYSAETATRSIPLGKYRITSVNDITVNLLKGENYSLPLRVDAITVDNQYEQVDVIWDSATAVDTSSLGTRVYEGTVPGYSRKIKCTVTVQEISSINDIYKTRYKGQTLSVPNMVEALMSDGTKRYINVTWNGTIDTSALGDFVYEGAVAGSNRKAKFYLSVIQRDNEPSGQVIGRINDWIYYKNIQDANKLYRIKSDGTGKSLVVDSNWLTDIQVGSSYICYGDGNDSTIYRVNLDGSNKVKLCSGITYKMQLTGNYLYYTDMFEERLYKVNILTSERTKVIDQIVVQYYVSGDLIYFDNEYFTYGLYKMKTDGTGLQCIRQDYLNVNHSIYVIDNWIYYVGNSNVCKVATDGTGYKILKENYYGTIHIDNGYIYYSDDNDIYKLSLDGSQSQTFNTFGGTILGIVDGWIYFNNPMDDNLLYKVRTDGTGYIIA